jgi:hypothetical protein
MLTVSFHFDRKGIMRNQTVICDFCGRHVIGAFAVVKIEAGNAELVARVPGSRDACTECFNRINEVGRQNAAFESGAASVGPAVGMTLQPK